MILTAERISKKYDDKVVLNEASLQIDKGEFISLLGESGIGKSTFAKIICGSIPSDGGSCTRLGLEVQMVYQQPWSALDPNQRIGKGFEELIKYHGFAKGKGEIRQLISEKLQMVELKADILSHFPRQISGGEAQRVCIAKALLFDPKLLILDEATSMLDVKTQQEIIALVKHLICGAGGAVLLITHDRELAERSSDRIYELSEGKTLQKE